MHEQVAKMIERIEHLPPERIAEVADFVEFLQQKENDIRLREDFSQASEASFRNVWDNDDDAAYDAL